MKSTRQSILSGFIAGLCLCLPMVLGAVEISDRYRSPRNAERPVRRATTLIVLHTTEGAARGSLIKLCERGEAHFCVTEEGAIYRIIDRDREAFHAGRSMWNGQEDVDKFSIGIEVVGQHDKSMPLVQLTALGNLVKELQRMYRLGDDRVICHSHVAYGAPNKWQRHKHRGRKRCGMLFAMPSVRRILGLKTRPGLDPDTRARRLVVGDDYLKQVLYGGIDTMSAVYGRAKAAPPPKKTSERGSGLFAGLASLFSRDGQRYVEPPKPKPTTVKPKPTSAKPGATTAKPVSVKPKPTTAKPTAAKPKPTPAKPGATTAKPVSVKPKPTTAKPKPTPTKPTAAKPRPVLKAAVPKTVADLKKIAGCAPRGTVGAGRSAWSIAGRRWNSPDTYYVIRGKVTPGDRMALGRIEKGTEIWFVK